MEVFSVPFWRCQSVKNPDVAVSAPWAPRGLMGKEPGQEDICVLESVGNTAAF